ncbi:Uma2 family endonuclease [Rhodopirellula sp. JC639]|uniref:Uma2 family endonuclease n=1 Tax=Stieleria mannarensis TaxID=2755585 RepID=UPI0015FED46B|nr:Uma2 family endonuclease [Rhodopirellula sp. JC639]
MSSSARYHPHYTIEDYRHWEGDWELWHGTAIAMTPSPFGRHGGLLAKLCTVLTIAIDQAGCDASVLAEVDWIVADDTVLRPDVSVVCGDPPEGHIESTPAMVAEVLSDSTRDRDLIHKRALYQENCVPWYLIADPLDSSVQLLRLGENQEYIHVAIDPEVELTICETCRLLLDLRWLSR